MYKYIIISFTFMAASSTLHILSSMITYVHDYVLARTHQVHTTQWCTQHGGART